MKKIIIIVLVVMQSVAYAQKFSAAEQSLVDAENSFAAYSKNKNTRDAFIAFLSDSVVLFDKGRPVIGTLSWLDRKPDTSLLFWWPVFVGVSADANTGFSIGPWEWSKSRREKPQAFGYYITVWQRPKDGEWKVAADIGVSLPGEEKEHPGLKASSVKNSKTKNNVSAKAREELLDHDNAYLVQLNKN